MLKVLFNRAIIFLREKWNTGVLFSATAVFGAVFLVLGATYFPSVGISFLDDHFFHFKYAYLLRTEGFSAVSHFDWIYLTKIGEGEGRQSVSLFQIALIPFTFVKDLVLGLKISDAFWASLSVALVYAVFRKARVKMPLLFTLFLLSSSFFTSRLLVGRALVLVPALLLWEMYLATKKDYRKLFWVSLFHVLWHSATFFFPLLIVFLVETARFFEVRKIALRNFAWSGLGMVLASLFYPEPLRNLWLWTKNILGIQGAILGQSVKGEGAELYTKEASVLLWGYSGLFFLVTMLGVGLVVYFALEKRNQAEVSEKDKELSILLYVSFLFSLLAILGSTLVSGRFFDFYYVGAVFLGALATTKIFAEKKIVIDAGARKYLAAMLMVFFLATAGNVVAKRRLEIQSTDYRPLQEVATWIKERSVGQEKVFLNNWSHFPTLFFFNSDAVYSMGIEPRTLYEYSPKLYWRWYSIAYYGYYCEKEQDCDTEVSQEIVPRLSQMNEEERKEWNRENGRRMIESIRSEFDARFLVATSEALREALVENEDLVEDGFETVSQYSGDTYRVFKLK